MEDNKSVENNVDKKHYDVGIVGWWYNLNYGGTLTYYALNKAIEAMGHSVLMILRSTPKNKSLDLDTVPFLFSQKHYSISNVYSYDELPKLNDVCDSFIAGSDQLWNPYLMTWSGPEFFLSFAADDKKRISYAASFGNIQNCDRNFIAKYAPLIRKFDAVSVREDYASDICRDDFGITGVHVCDPVFLCDRDFFCELANDSKMQLPEKYVLNFLLDPDKDKTDACKFIKRKFGITESVNFTDLQDVEQHTENFDGEKVEANADIEDLVKAYANAEFVVTDSFHGTCFAVIFNKPFISIANLKRGEKRFISLLKWLGLSDKLVFDYDEIYVGQSIFEPIDYIKVNEIISDTREKDLNWLRNAIETPKDELPSIILSEHTSTYDKIREEQEKLQRAVDGLYANPDFIKIRILATLLHNYGVRHIVLSPGGRDVPLIRMFEYNENMFTLHSVTDERSAAYFALGIAAQIKNPVACVCTSGTAASNYLPAVTEAYYTGMPLIVITADRRQIYLNHGEDQTIPQKHIYDGVIKKSVTLPEDSGYMAEYQTRRDISDCILEATHNGFGPVHINISIDNIAVGSNVPREYWGLLPYIHPHIMRVSANDDDSEMMRWVNELLKSRKILVVYGQNPPPTDEQKRYIEAFASKFNCVIVTDFISNLDCAYSLKPYNMLNAISQQEFNAQLSPDILVTVGGKRLMNDPLTYKIRGGAKNIRHWSVTPDGRVKDFYFRLTSVIETSQDYFFRWFSDHAGDVRNNGVYYDAWKNLTAKYNAPEIKRFNAHYVQSRFIPAVPANSILHLGVGQSFYDSRRYTLNESVEVFCNMGTNGIDGCTSAFMGQCSVVKDKLCFLLVGDLSFFYDMNSIWNKKLT
ncbi:MAG: 2-succinyl-5-enolpyruvyl-6-hydroxy-3-cyclohexene-1-carboxylic-acid synthase, partial [Ruminococcus sp.]|nr:2-succinyl-5-enolpyruvyl-6-hydroxy-3-cyclohexene-1-carboxylic-acid synthase [Ruminococcus sp.]